MGTSASASDEWIELKNTSATTVDVTGWQVVSVSGHVHFVVNPASDNVRTTRLAPGSFYLLERTDDNTVPGTSADALYTGALSNSSASAPEGLTLFDANCRPMDEVQADVGADNESWPAGDAGTRSTMERNDGDLGWHTSSYAGGTPKGPNSMGLVGTPPSTGSGGGPPPAVTSTESHASEEDAGTSTSTELHLPKLASSTVYISEVQVAGVDAGDEFVELYNAGDTAVDLSGGSLEYAGGAGILSASSSVSKKNFEDGATIPAHGFFLVARGLDAQGKDGYRGTTTPDTAHRSFSLSGASTGGTVLLVAGADRVNSVDDMRVVDYVRYSGFVPAASSSIERKAFEGDVCISAASGTPGALRGNACAGHDQSVFELRSGPEPQNTRSEFEPRDEEEGDGGDEALPPPEGIFSLASFHTSSTEPLHQAQLDLVLSPSYAVWNDPSSTQPWYLIVPYLNREPGAEHDISTAQQLTPEGAGGVLLHFTGCNNGETVSAVMVLPLSIPACQGGGLLSGAYRFRDMLIEGFAHMAVTIPDGSAFKPTDYLTFGLYIFAGGRAGEYYFTFSVADPTHRVLSVANQTDTAGGP